MIQEPGRAMSCIFVVVFRRRLPSEKKAFKKRVESDIYCNLLNREPDIFLNLKPHDIFSAQVSVEDRDL